MSDKQKCPGCGAAWRHASPTGEEVCVFECGTWDGCDDHGNQGPVESIDCVRRQLSGATDILLHTVQGVRQATTLEEAKMATSTAGVLRLLWKAAPPSVLAAMRAAVETFDGEPDVAESDTDTASTNEDKCPEGPALYRMDGNGGLFAEDNTSVRDDTCRWWIRQDEYESHVLAVKEQLAQRDEEIERLREILGAIAQKVCDEIMVFQDIVGWQEGESRNKLVGEIASKIKELIGKEAAEVAKEKKPASMPETLERIHAAGGKVWDKIEDPEALIADMRGQCHTCHKPISMNQSYLGADSDIYCSAECFWQRYAKEAAEAGKEEK